MGKKSKGVGGIGRKDCYNIFLMNFFWEGEDKDMRRHENDQTSNVFSFKIPFWGIYEKLAHSLLGAWSFLLIHIRSTSSEGPKGIGIWFFEEIGPWKLDHGKWPSSMV